MEENKYKRGSEWRRWDLHVHTPKSIINNYGGDSDEIWEKYITALEKLPPDVSIIGITDYYFIDGYEKVLEYKSKGRLKNIQKIFPILEFRVDTFGSGNENKLQKINLHILFNLNEGKIKEEIERVKKRFIEKIPLTKLEKHKTVELSKENFVQEAGNLNTGFNDLIPSTDKVFELIKTSEWENDTFLFLGYKEWSNLEKNNQLKPFKEDLYKKVGAFFSSNNSTISASQQWLNEYGNKRLLHSGDIHDFDKLTTNYVCNTWIKADPTFEGLKQIINEPDRVHIGENKPQLLERVETYPTKFIKNISIKKKDDSTIDEEWYGDNTSIDINPGLVAIVGNKGSGKSAITDIISLCANTHKSEFSFLRNEKFRNPKPYNRAKNFEAQLTWFDDNKTDYRLLDKDGDLNQPEMVKYIPQNFLENLCTTENDKEFEKEMKSIIFQHIPITKRYEKNSLEEIIDYLSSEIKESEKEIKLQISEQNKIIIDLEDKKREDYKEQINNAKTLKEKELKNLSNVKPIEVLKPNHENSEEEKRKQEAIDSLRVQLKTVESEINNTQDELTRLNKQIQDLNASKEKLERLNVLVQNTIDEVKSIFDDTQLNVSEIVKFSVDIDVVQSKIDSLKSKQEEKMSYLAEDGEKSLRLKKTDIESQIQKAEKELSEPDRLYHRYVEDLKNWQEKVDAIIGNTDTIDTIEYYNSQLKYIEEQLVDDISKAYEKRKILVLELLSKKRNELNIRSELYQPVSSFIESNSDLENYSMTLDATFIFNGIENFFDYINQGKSGTFYGKEQGTTRMKELQENVSLIEDNSIYNFAQTLNNALFNDYRNNNTSCDIKTQIKDSHNQLELYDFIYGLDYIEPLFQLKLDDKPLLALSPGERGALLLLFYLFIDMDDKPLIIDQPEENLDNESVYKYLVKFIKQAKEKRQIIMVTHNPNLAVVCDADQVIKMDIDKKNKNTVSFMSGSIENPDMNRCIVDVLEGTYPAFHNRDNKYFDKAIR